MAFKPKKLFTKFTAAKLGELAATLMGVASVKALNAGEQHINTKSPPGIHRTVNPSEKESEARSIEQHLITVAKKNRIPPENLASVLRAVYLARYKDVDVDTSKFTRCVRDFERKHSIRKIFEQYTNVPPELENVINEIDLDLIERTSRDTLDFTLCSSVRRLLESIGPDNLEETERNYVKNSRVNDSITRRIYRNDLITLRQLKNRGVFRHYWQGTRFYKIPTPFIKRNDFETETEKT